MKFTAALVVASLATVTYAQNHTVPEKIECGPDIIVDDFSVHRQGALPGETLIRDLNALGGDYGKSANDSVTFVINDQAKQVEITAGPNAPEQNFFFAKFDAGACYDLTNIASVAFDLTAPQGSTFSMTLTQKNPDCVDRAASGSDSSYIPITKYVTPNGQKLPVVVPFSDFSKNLNGSAFDFVHLKDWTLTGLQPLGAKFFISNLRLQRSCKDNGPTGKNVTTTPPAAGGNTPTGTTTGSAPAATKTEAAHSSAERLYAVAGLGFGTLIAALAMF